MPVARRRLAAALTLLTIGAGGAVVTATAASAHAGLKRAAVTAAAPASGFVAVAPQRLLDTRTESPEHPLPSAGTRSLQVMGVGAVPDTGVEAVVLNVTGITAARSSYLTVYPKGAARPLASNLNLITNTPRANQVIVRVGSAGWVTIFASSGPTNVVVDLDGYLRSGSSYTSTTPYRALDTRTTGTRAPVAPAHITSVKLAGVGPVPASGVSAVVVNLTGISTKGPTFVTAYAHGSARPGTSNLNLAAGQIAPVLVVAPVGPDGRVDLYNSGGPTHLVVDVEGWFTGSSDYTPLAPTRLVDTRTTGGAPYQTDTALQVSGIGGVPSGAGAAVLSVTLVRPASKGYLTVHPHGTPLPATSNLNGQQRSTTANVVLAQLSSDGRVDVYDAAFAGDYVVDVVGWLSTNTALELPAQTLPAATVGQPYSAQVATNGGLAPLTFFATSALPPGLTLSSSGLISGTPTAAGDTDVPVTADDNSAERATRTLAIHVDA